MTQPMSTGGGSPETCPTCGTELPVAQTVAKKLRCDIIIFTATSTERQKLKEAAQALGMPWTKISNPLFEAVDLGSAVGGRVVSIHTNLGAFGGNGSAANAVLARNITGATTLIAVGMAFGIDRAVQKVGDVLVSTSLLTYDDRVVKRNSDGGMVTEFPDDERHPHRIYYPANPTMVELLENATSRQGVPKVWLGSLLTGGCAVQCAAYRDDLLHHLTHVLQKRSERPGEAIVGGEMEGSGLLATGEWEKPAWVVVKGISDFGDERRAVASKEEVAANRDLACENAAGFVLEALRNYRPTT